MKNNCFMCIDIGTTAVKAGIFDAAGNTIGLGSSEYTLETPATDIVELDCAVYYKAVQDAVKKAFAAGDLPKACVKSCTVTGQVETLILLDENDNELRKAIVWLDNRGRIEAEELMQLFGSEKLWRISGQTEILPCFPAPKIMHIKKHEPEVFSKCSKYMMVEDYITYKLTGKFVSCSGLWPSSVFYNIVTHCWEKEILDSLGIDICQLPELVPPGSVLAQCSENNGLLEPGTLLVGAPLDHAVGALGAGCGLSDGIVSETIGCTMAICAPGDGVMYDEQKKLSTYEGFAVGQTVLLPWAPAAGMLLKYFRDNFGEGLDYRDLDRLAETVPPGSDGLLMLPHVAGAVSPEMAPDAAGCVYGITLQHTRGHWVRAIMESVAYLLRDNLEALKSAGCKIKSVRALGGASYSKLWMQILSDVLNLPLAKPESAETTALGGAILAAVAAGEFGSLAEASQAMCRTAGEVFPKPENSVIYEEKFRRYRRLNELMLNNLGGIK